MLVLICHQRRCGLFRTLSILMLIIADLCCEFQINREVPPGFVSHEVVFVLFLPLSEKEVRVEVARQREVKWLDMFRNWDKWIKHRFQKVPAPAQDAS